MQAEPRAITDAEIRVVRAALLRAPFGPMNETLLASLDMLRVVARCECGCASVDFQVETGEPATRVADGVATSRGGGQVGVLVWAQSGAISSLEIYDLGAGDGDLGLPVPESVRPWASG